MTGVWVTNDTISAVRMNEKTIFQGSGSDINGLTTYAGMLAFCTSTGSGFIVDNLYQRDSTNSSWGIIGVDKLPYLTLSTTIGDYTSPNAAVATSESSTGQAVFGTNADQSTETFATYTDQTDANTSWVPSSNANGSRVDITDDDLEGTTTGKATFQVYYDLGAAVSDTAFELRFKLVLNWTAASTADQNFMFFGISSNTSDAVTAQDFLGLGIKNYTSNEKYRIVEANGVELTTSAAYTDFTHAPTDETVYVKIKRTSTTSASITLYSDSSYTTVVETQTATISSGTAGLRYVKLAYHINNNVGTTNEITVDIDDIILNPSVAEMIYDNSTSTRWQSNSEASPAIYVDLSGSAREIVGVALNLDRTNTTITAIKIRASTDTTFDDTENIMYVNVTDFTDDTWRFLANNFSTTNKRYVQVIGVGTGVLALNEIKVRYGVSDLIKILSHKHRTRVTSSADSFSDSN